MQNTSSSPTPDPFGRIISDDGSQDRFRNMPDISSIEAVVGPTDENRPDDVARIEIMLDHIGLLDLRETDGPTGYFGERLRQAIIAFQKQINAPQSGKIFPGDTVHESLRNTLTSMQSGGSHSHGPAESVHSHIPRESEITG